jgi:hypothetical protein
VNAKKFLAELKRRNVYRAAILYGMVAWLLAQMRIAATARRLRIQVSGRTIWIDQTFLQKR